MLLLTVRTFLTRQRGTAFGLVVQGLQYGSGLLLLPFVVTRLSTAEVGIWYVFITVQGLAVLADFGFQPTLARSFAAAFHGAPELHSQGLAEARAGDLNLSLLAAIFAAARRLYLGLAVAVLVLLLSGGLFYISALTRGQVASLAAIQLAWATFAAGTALNIYFLWISPFLLGAERIEQNYLYLLLNRGSFALLGIAALMLGGGLMGLALATVVASLFARVAIGRSLAPLTARWERHQPSRDMLRTVFAAIWPNAWRMGLVMLGAFLTLRVNVLLVSIFVGLTAAGSYAISLQLLTVTTIMAQLPMQIALPKMVKARVQGERVQVWRLFSTRTLFFLGVTLIGVLAIAFVAPSILALIGSDVELLPPALLMLLGLILLLEGNQSNCAFVISTGNHIPFVRASIISGLAVATLSTLAMWAGGGILAAILAQGVVQLAYNNWKWPVAMWRELREEPSG